MPTNTVDILLQIQADTANVTRAVKEAQQLAQVQKEATDAAKRQAAEQKVAAERAIEAEIRRRETAIEALQFQREQIAVDAQGGGVRRVERENALLARQAKLTQEIIAIKRSQMAGQDELQRANTLREIQRLEQGIAKAARDTAKAQQDAANSTQKMGSMAGTLAKYAAGFVGIQQAVGFIRTGITNALDLAEGFKNTADRLETTTDAVQVIDFAFRRGGLSINEASQAIYNFNRRLDEARTSTKAAEPFDKLGLSVEKLTALRPEYRMVELGRAMRATEGDAGALAAVVDIVGNKSQRTFDVIKQFGDVGFDRMKKDAEDLGQLMDPEMVRRLEKAKQSMEDFGRRKDIALGGVAQYFADALTGLNGSREEQLEKDIRLLRAQGKKRGDENLLRAEIAKLQSELDLIRAERMEPQAPIPIPGSFGDIGAASDAADAAAAAEEARKATEAKALAEEQANRWLGENAAKLEEQNQALREAQMTEEERIVSIGARLRKLDEENAVLLAAAGSEAERRKIGLEYDNKRLTLLKEYLGLVDKASTAAKKEIADQRRAERERVDLAIRSRETQISALQFERDQLGDRGDLSATEKRERINELLEREAELLREIYNLQASITPLTDEERAQREADLQATDQRIATVIQAGAPPSASFEKQIGLADELRGGMEGLATAIGHAAVGMGDLGEMASDVLSGLAADLAAATAKALLFRSIMAFAPGFGNFIGLPELGFAGGGFTGRGMRHEVAGVVHRGEYVVPKDVVDRTGPGAWAAAVRGVRGYADGGLVVPAIGAVSTSISASMLGAAGGFSRGRGGAEPTTVVQLNFEAGVTKQELAALMPQIEERVIAGVQDAQRRRKGGHR